MTTIADYRVIQRSKCTLGTSADSYSSYGGINGIGGDRQYFDFEIPHDIATSGNTKRPFITLFADPSSDADLIRLCISYDGEVILDYVYSGGVGRGHILVCPHHWRDENRDTPYPTRLSLVREVYDQFSNYERFINGTISISDIVVWFQRDIDL
jgi:hypothetical protein